MKRSAKCSIAIHSLLVIALFGEETKVTSDLIARSTGSNAVTIRNIFHGLREQGIITVKRGTGGTLLNRPPSEITLWEIYTAVEPEEAQSLIGRHPAPYEQCPVGKHIYELLAVPYQRVGTAVHQELEQYTLEMLLNHYKELNPQGYALPTERKTHD